MYIVIFWVFLSGVAASIASNKGRSGTGFFFLSVILSPLIGIVAALVAKPNKKHLEWNALASGDSRKCPQCAELIKTEAKVCRYCGMELPLLTPQKSAHEEVTPLGLLKCLGISAICLGVVIAVILLIAVLLGVHPDWSR